MKWWWQNFYLSTEKNWDSERKRSLPWWHCQTEENLQFGSKCSFWGIPPFLSAYLKRGHSFIYNSSYFSVFSSSFISPIQSVTSRTLWWVVVLVGSSSAVNTLWLYFPKKIITHIVDLIKAIPREFHQKNDKTRGKSNCPERVLLTSLSQSFIFMNASFFSVMYAPPQKKLADIKGSLKAFLLWGVWKLDWHKTT